MSTKIQLVTLLVLVLLGACNGAMRRPAKEPPSDASRLTSVIYVARRGWHIDIGFGAQELEPPLRSLRADFPGVRYLFFGFGDRHYLMAKNKHSPSMIAALWPGPGLILATGLAATPQQAFGDPFVIELPVTPEQAQTAQRFIRQSLSMFSGQIVAYAAGPYQGSLYFGSSKNYSAIHTCNTWGAEVLGAADLPVRSAGVVLAGQLWKQVRRISHTDESLNRGQSPARLIPAPGTMPSQEQAMPMQQPQL